MAEAANRIHSKGPYTHEEYDTEQEGIYPGHLLTLNSSNNVVYHADENGRAEAIFAEEDALQGRTVDQVYELDDTAEKALVSCILPLLGCEIRALIQDDQDISIGDRLVSAGDGTLKALGDLDSEAADIFVIAVAMEACDCTGSSSPSKGVLCRVRITAGN